MGAQPVPRPGMRSAAGMECDPGDAFRARDRIEPRKRRCLGGLVVAGRRRRIAAANTNRPCAVILLDRRIGQAHDPTLTANEKAAIGDDAAGILRLVGTKRREIAIVERPMPAVKLRFGFEAVGIDAALDEVVAS